MQVHLLAYIDFVGFNIAPLVASSDLDLLLFLHDMAAASKLEVVVDVRDWLVIHIPNMVGAEITGTSASAQHRTAA